MGVSIWFMMVFMMVNTWFLLWGIMMVNIWLIMVDNMEYSGMLWNIMDDHSGMVGGI